MNNIYENNDLVRVRFSSYQKNELSVLSDQQWRSLLYVAEDKEEEEEFETRLETEGLSYLRGSKIEVKILTGGGG